MKAVVVRKPKARLELDEREPPKPKAEEVLIRVRACGVCHGDLMLQQGEFPFVTYPIVPGHEVAGVITESGEGVEQWKVGDRVGLSALFSTCGACRSCLSGDESLCAQWCWTGLMTDGGYQEFMIAKAAYLAPLPEEIDFAEIAPVMCAGLTVFSGLRHAGFEPGSKVAVIGFGGLGQYGVLYAKAMGARVAVVSTSPEKEAEARQMGAERFIDATQGSLADSLRKWEGGADIILATSPSLEPMNAAFPGLAPKGTMVVLGVGPGNLQIDPMILNLGRRRLMGSPAGSRRDLHDALAFAGAHHLRPKITPYALEDAERVLAEMLAGHMSGRAVLVPA